MTYAVVRVRGRVNIRREVRDTLGHLRLHRVNHCVLVPENPSVNGMLVRAKDYITWGEVDPDVVSQLLTRRARLAGDKALDDAYVKANTQFPTLKALAEAIAAERASPVDVPGMKPVLRLHPPRGGYEATKRGYAQGGTLGYRGKDINPLLVRMLGSGGS